MITIYFLYGLSFIILGIVIFTMPKRDDFLDISNELWLVGMFGFIHGINEWIELLILAGTPFNELLKNINAFSLPVSFIFLVIFGTRIICRERPKLCFLKYAWVVCALLWTSVFLITKDLFLAGIFARYFICFPGTILCAIALSMRVNHIEGEGVPRTIIYGGAAAIIGFILYGIFSGIIVPRADFFPASLINYSSFLKYTGSPVQLFRMGAAMIITISFFGVAGLFYRIQDAVIFRGGVRRKISLMISGLTLFVIIIGSIVGYSNNYRLLRDAVIRSNREIADIATISVTQIIDEKIAQLKSLAIRIIWVRASEESDKNYAGMSAEEILSYMAEMDKKWISADKADPFVKKYLYNESGLMLNDLLRGDTGIKEIFITDSHGGLVAASGKVTDFYQADEKWWQESFGKGKGRVFVGDVEMDESTNTLSVSMATPMRNSSGGVVGICKIVFDVNHIFAPLGKFKIENEGRLALVEKDGSILFFKGIVPLSAKICGEDDMKKLLNGHQGFVVAKNVPFFNEEMFLVYSKVSSRVLDDMGINWNVVVVQPMREIFAPLATLAFQATGLLMILAIIPFPLGYVFGKRFVTPITELKKGIEVIAKGDLDYKVQVMSDDEIGQLAASFNFMTSNLKAMTASRDELNEEIEERKRAESELKKLATIVEFAQDAIFSTVDGKITTWNRGAELIYGYSKNEIIGKPVSILAPANRQDEVADNLKKIQSGEHIERFGTVRMRKDGRVIDVLLSISPIYDDGGKITGAGAIVSDITRQKRVEEALKSIEERYRVVYESSSDAIMIIYPDGRLFTGNRSAIKIFGCSDESEFVSYDVIRLSPEKQPDGASSAVRAKEMIAMAIENGSHSFEWVHRRLDGSAFYASVLLTRIELQGASMIQATVRDISEIKKAQAEVVRAASEWQRTFDSMSDIVFIMDLKSTIIKINKTFTDKLGKKLGDVIGKKCYEVMHKGSAHWPSCPLASTYSDSTSHTEEVDDPVIGIPLLVTTSPLLDDKGKMVGVVHVAKDITEIKKAEEAMKEAVDIKEQFISIASHELRSPMAIIKESIEIISDETADKAGPQAKKFIGIARRNIERLVRLSNNILDFQKLSAGKFEFNIAKHDINKTVKEASVDMDMLAKDKGLEFLMNFAEDLPPIRFDKDAITEVVTNLVSNAIKFTDKGRITVSSERATDGVIVSVSDTGPGISEEDMAKLFQPFHQVGSARDKKGGTGLGLAISQAIVDQHKGRIWVESKLGSGTTFRFLLPLG